MATMPALGGMVAKALTWSTWSTATKADGVGEAQPAFRAVAGVDAAPATTARA
jgi:hypothetical protein